MYRFILILTIAVTAAGCVSVHNPARHPTPSSEELFVTERGLFRGEEKLDEQDFYQLAKDHKSAQKIERSRAKGERQQRIGSALVGLGVGILASGLVSLQIEAKGIETGIPSWATWGAIATGALVGTGGAGMRRGGKKLAAPSKRMFDNDHALASLETGRYGPGGLTASSIKSLELTTASGAPRICGYSGVELKDLVAKDGEGLTIKLDGRRDWFAWKTTPADLLGENASEDAESRPVRFVRSPLRGSLAALGTKVAVTVTVKESGLSQTLELPISLGCEERHIYSGSEGASGNSGREGPKGAPGGDGGAGAAGGQGDDVEVEVAHVSAPDHPRLLLVASSKRGSGAATWTLVDPGQGGGVEIIARGGRGGSGGRGGEGGDAVDIQGLVGSDCNVLKGAVGGTGGVGGPGGAGGRVVVRGASQAAIDAISVNVSGGAGGFAGSGGSGGSGVHRASCNGPRGPGGNTGAAGAQGPRGSETRSVVPASKLSMIAEALATNSAIALEGAPAAPAMAKKEDKPEKLEKKAPKRSKKSKKR